ncbi:GDSL esterase/lipase At5g62930 isoform X3 [Apium graveolens]|uniref:GDSL esterase/lipase At5g62930 isoform X3 n=1 Tax=Apium graveolens TaxID=4045 RepID=UPI003D7BEC3F
MRPQIVLFGDSITQQSFSLGAWGAALADTFSRKADVLVRGYGGYNTRWALFLLHHIFPLDAATPPLAVTIFFGANDAALSGRTSERQHVPVEEYKENLRKIVHHIKCKCASSISCSWSTLFRRLVLSPQSIAILIALHDCRNAPIRSLYGDKAMKLPERTNEVTGLYAKQCIELAEELGIPSINLWSKMQETDGWQKKFLK